MKFHMYEGFGLSYPVVEIDGEIYGTINSIAGELGITTDAIHTLIRRRPDMFKAGLRPSDRRSNEELIGFLQQNKSKLGIIRLRGDMRLLARREMIRISRLADSKKAWAYQERLDDVTEEYWKTRSVAVEVFEQEHRLRVEAEKERDTFKEEVSGLRADLDHTNKIVHQQGEQIEMVMPYMDALAELSGKSLQAQKGTKAFRNMN